MMFGERRCARWYIARGHYDEAEQARHVYKLAKIASGYEVPYVDGWTVDAPKNFWNDASLHFVLTLKDAYRKGNSELGKPFRVALGEWLTAVAKSPDLSEAPESRVAIWNDALEVDGDFVALYGGDQEHVDLVLSLVECEWAAAAMCEAAEYHDDVRRENVLLRAENKALRERRCTGKGMSDMHEKSGFRKRFDMERPRLHTHDRYLDVGDLLAHAAYTSDIITSEDMREAYQREIAT